MSAVPAASLTKACEAFRSPTLTPGDLWTVVVLLSPEDQITAFRTALAHPSDEVRTHSALALAGFGAEGALLLVSALDDPAVFVRQVAVEALSEHGGEDSVALLRQALDDPKNLEAYALQDAARDGIERMTGKRPAKPGSEPVRRAKAPKSGPSVPAPLKRKPTGQRANRIRELISRLGEYEGADQVVNELVKLGPEAIPLLLGVLDGSTGVSPGGHWRDAHDGIAGAMHALAGAYPREYLSLARQVDALGNEWLDHSIYVSALGEVGLWEAVPPLVAATRSKNEWTRHAAAQALAWREEPALVDTFKRLLRHSDGIVRLHAAEGLSRLGGAGDLVDLEKAASAKKNRVAPLMAQAFDEALKSMRERLADSAD